MAVALRSPTKALSEIAAAAVAAGVPITKLSNGAVAVPSNSPAKNVVTLPLAIALWASIEPKVAALDDGWDPAAGTRSQGQQGIAGMGHERPSSKDKQLLGWIEYNCKQYHQQLYGTIVNRDTGGTYDNATQRLQKSERDLADYMREKQQIDGARYDGVSGNKAQEDYLSTFNQVDVDTSPRMMSLIRWNDINSETVGMLSDHLNAWVYCYEKLTSKKWVAPTYEDVVIPQKAAATAQKDDANKQKVLDRMRKLLGDEKVSRIMDR